jgi:hypothetical protein
MRTLLTGLTVAVLFAPAQGQTPLHGVRGNGDLLFLERSSGHGWALANCGIAFTGAAGVSTYYGRGGTRDYMYGVGSDAQGQNVLVQIDQYSGQISAPQPIPCPPGTRVRAIAAISPSFPTATLLLADTSGQADDAIATFNWVSGLLSPPQPIGVRGLTGLAHDSGGTLYGLGPANGGTLYQVPSPGSAEPVWIGGLQNCQSILVEPSGVIVAVGSEFRVIDTAAGTNTLIGLTGLPEVLGLQRDSCYVNCTDGPPPMLNVLDFNCYLNRFIAGDPYANCDGSTTAPVLNVLDFNCFLNRFWLGCP